MQQPDIANWKHDHVFDLGNTAGERGTRAVAWLTALMMVVEIVAGWWYNSMALLADGCHMSSHALAIGLSAFAYAAARRYTADTRFAFGTWKIEVLGGFASAILLMAVVALMVSVRSSGCIAPQPIHYLEAMIVAAMGLVVNIVSALILGNAHHEDRASTSRGDDHHHHHDLNLKSAYVHVIADAATSVLAISRWLAVGCSDGLGSTRSWAWSARCWWPVGEATDDRHRQGTAGPGNGPSGRR